METFIGFDSAWTDNPRAPGAIAAVTLRDNTPIAFHPPRLVCFTEALAFIRDLHRGSRFTLVALDQPTIVTNATSMRPVERAAASLICWLGGGVQPSNTGRLGMFSPDAPIWRFLAELGAVEDPEAARTATAGLFLAEVFPAIALASLNDTFFGRRAAPRYNPARRNTFRPADWPRVAAAAAAEAAAFGCTELAEWCRVAAAHPRPAKADQDRLDAALCTVIALRWRRRPREHSMLLGDLRTGYMILPASQAVRTRLTEAAHRIGVPVDGYRAESTDPIRSGQPYDRPTEPKNKGV